MRGEEEGDSLGIFKAPFFRTRPADGHNFRTSCFMVFLSSSVVQKNGEFGRLRGRGAGRVVCEVRAEPCLRVCRVSRHPAPPFLHVSRVPCVSRLPPVLFEQLHCELVPSRLRYQARLTGVSHQSCLRAMNENGAWALAVF